MSASMPRQRPPDCDFFWDAGREEGRAGEAEEEEEGAEVSMARSRAARVVSMLAPRAAGAGAEEGREDGRGEEERPREGAEEAAGPAGEGREGGCVSWGD